MRRPAPALPLSPKVLRHFAVVTVILTVAIALFADENNRNSMEDAVAQREAKNQMLVNEANQFGKHKLRAKPLGPDIAAGFADDEPMLRGDSAGGGRSSMPPIPSTRAAGGLVPPPALPMTPGASVTVRSVPGDYLPTAQGTSPKQTTPFRPNQKQIEAIHQTSRERSGNPAGND